jgi:hypothetical protein
VLPSEEQNVAKIVYKSLNRRPSVASPAVGKKRIPAAEGRSKTVHTLDANSASFDEDLRYVFSRNVAKARRENKRVVGSPDIAPRKR